MNQPGTVATPIPKPSMKVPPKRKGNVALLVLTAGDNTLNESPSEKEGKYKQISL